MKLLTKISLLCFCVSASAQENLNENEPEARILSAYHGLDPLPPRATQLCGLPPAAGQDGMPVVFSAQINGDTVSPTAFAVEISSGETVTPLCATLRPALESLEQRTVLLIGPFSPEDSLPVSVEIVEQLEDINGNSLVGLRREEVTSLASGPSLVFAERFAPDTPGLEGECPEQTAQAILLTWEGGVTGPQGADLAEAQRTAVSVLLANGDSVPPLALADDDPDNHVIACIAETSPAVSVSVEAGFFHDPGNDANPDTRKNVTPKKPTNFTVTRLGDGPIITPGMDERMGGNIQGPSLIKVPDWVENPLGNYYLYFADHRGIYIRMAYADELTGPWTVYTPGSLTLEDSFFPATCPPCSQAPGSTAPLYAHIASPDVHVREDLQQIVMYYHGRDVGRQFTRAAVSRDGIHFEGREEDLGRAYFRVIEHEGFHYAMSMPGYLYRSRDGLTNFEAGPRFFTRNMRHSALLIRDERLHVFFTNRGDEPERIMLSTIELTDDWNDWIATDPIEVMRPEMDYEGADLPMEASRGGYIDERVHQLRDPAIFQEGDKTYLLYSVAGESGIAVAEIEFSDRPD